MSGTAVDVPPGISYTGKLVVQHSGGKGDWVPIKRVKLYTNAFIRQKDKGSILMGYKKRGFGLGLYNGFGGKVEAGETVLEAAVRELHEEAGITASLRSCGRLFFILEGADAAFDIDIFVADEYSGTITESDEMRPQWFSTGSIGNSELPTIPYEKMWADDPFWMPMLLENRHFVGRADFTKDGQMRKWWFADQIA